MTLASIIQAWRDWRKKRLLKKAAAIRIRLERIEIGREVMTAMGSRALEIGATWLVEMLMNIMRQEFAEHAHLRAELSHIEKRLTPP